MAWNGSDKRKTNGASAAKRPVGGAKKGPSIMRGAFAALAVVVGAGLAWWLLSRPSAPTSAVDAQPARVKDDRPKQIVPPVDSGRRAEGIEEVGATDAQKPEQVEEEKKPGVFAPGMIRLPNGFELRFKLPAEGETRQLLAGGEIWEIDSKGEIQNVTPPPIFEKPFEGMISALYERDGMVLPFALKRYSEEEVRRMCKEPTLSYDDDTPEIIQKRENVAMLKQAILEFLDGGGTFEEFVDDMQQHSQNAQRAQIEGMRGIRDLLEAGKDDEALRYYRLLSQDMADKGYGELKLPGSYIEALTEIAAKENNDK